MHTEDEENGPSRVLRPHIEGEMLVEGIGGRSIRITVDQHDSYGQSQKWSLFYAAPEGDEDLMGTIWINETKLGDELFCYQAASMPFEVCTLQESFLDALLEMSRLHFLIEHGGPEPDAVEDIQQQMGGKT